jgi:hypothetical protein
MTSSQLQEFARFGAQARLQAIEEERNAIIRAFPDLGREPGTSNGSSSPATRGRKGMSPSQRKAIGERMKAYWAKRRGEKGQTVAKTARKTKRKSGMSAEARKAQAERMRAYWATRRAEKGAARNGVQAEAGAGSSGKRKAPRKAAGKDARKK